MIGQAIQVMKVNRNAKKRPPKSSKNEMLVFGLPLTSDDWPSILNNESRPKWEGISMKDYTSTWTAVPQALWLPCYRL